MSSLWTPEGEHRVRPAAAPSAGTGEPPAPAAEQGARGAAAPPDLSERERAELAGELDELRRQLLGTPVEVVVANHVYGLFELAALHLSQAPPDLVPARLAIDAMAALVEGLGGRLGETEGSLRDALHQIRMAFVQLSREGPGDGAGQDDPGPGAGA
ncbi:MAG TPA: hypothetical protein VLZ77_12595 [Acidimicrobiales bacterium]|nr:hypothetical protein [Acidimicrobiales bacterium]